jgi:hypothetical protein
MKRVEDSKSLIENIKKRRRDAEDEKEIAR